MNNRFEAEDYIKRTLKSDETVQAETPLDKIKWKKTTINHVGIANTFAKLACLVPMPSRCREVIIYRLANPGVSYIQMAIMSGVRANDIMQWEFEAKQRMIAYLDKYTEQEILDKSNDNGLRMTMNEIRNLAAKDVPGGCNKLN